MCTALEVVVVVVVPGVVVIGLVLVLVLLLSEGHSTWSMPITSLHVPGHAAGVGCLNYMKSW